MSTSTGRAGAQSPFDIAPLESLTDDLLCVMDAAETVRAVIFGTHECGIITSIFAATYSTAPVG